MRLQLNGMHVTRGLSKRMPGIVGYRYSDDEGHDFLNTYSGRFILQLCKSACEEYEE